MGFLKALAEARQRAKDAKYVDECFAALEKAKDNEEEWTPELLNKLADPRFVAFLQTSASRLEAE